MRSVGPPSEVRKLMIPVFRFLDGLWQRMHWWILGMVILYAFSGITIIKPDEVAVILRWGRLVGDTPALQEHGPGLLFALPKPIDQVVRVQTRRVRELSVTALGYGQTIQSYEFETFDPLSNGYAITGDQNVVQVQMTARYRIRDAAEWAFYGPSPDDILRVEVSAAMIRSLGEMGVDRVLSDGRKDLIALATRRAQAGLDAAHSGLELSSLELTHLGPPPALQGDFDAVQSAYIGAQTVQNNALAYQQSIIPEAQAEADTGIEVAQGQAAAVLSIAQGQSAAFLALDRQYRANPAVTRERLYREAIDKAISAAGDVRWIPPPASGGYHGFRITLKPADPSEESSDQSDQSANQNQDQINTGSPAYSGEDGE